MDVCNASGGEDRCLAYPRKYGTRQILETMRSGWFGESLSVSSSDWSATEFKQESDFFASGLNPIRPARFMLFTVAPVILDNSLKLSF